MKKQKRNLTLTVKQQSFVDHYLANSGNGIQAAKSAGYKGNCNTLASVAKENLLKPLIKQAVDKALEILQQKTGATAENKRAMLWDVATNGTETMTNDFGDSVMTDSRATIAAIAELNKMDGDHAVKKVEQNGTFTLIVDTDDVLL